MQSVQELLDSLETLEDKENHFLTLVTYELNSKTNKPIDEEMEALRNAVDNIESLKERYAKSDYIQFLGEFESMEEQREKISQDLINTLTQQDLTELARSIKKNHGRDISQRKLEEIIDKLISNEKKMEKISDIVKEQTWDEFLQNSLDQSKRILQQERLTVIFDKNALNDFHRHAYQETYLGNSNQSQSVGKECGGYFEYEEIGSNKILLTKYHPLNSGYRSRSEEGFQLEDQKARELAQRDIVFAHTHPPGGQKSHSNADSTWNNPHDLAILAVPESKMLIWTIAQTHDSGKRWKNHIIEIEDGKVPRASLKKYNSAIVKALAFSEISDRFSNWQNIDVLDAYQNFSGRLAKHLKYTIEHDVGENQWVKYLDSKTR